MSDTPLPVFDGHNDLLLRLWRAEPAARDLPTDLETETKKNSVIRTSLTQKLSGCP